MVKEKKKFCSLCFTDIKENTKYNKFKHNTLFKGKYGEHDIWTALYTHYVCEDCLKKLQSYCQEGMYHEVDK